MANNYTITFKSLRAGTVYTVSVGGGTGTAIALKGGSQPFTTQEDTDEDIFTPIRTQSGYLRIVDDGKDANGNTLSADWWKDLIPATDTSRPVTLSHVENNTTIIDWQGFMQAQTFSGELYGNPQEREFPVQCALSALGGTSIKTDETAIRNFAYIIQHIFSQVPQLTFTEFVVQGGADARSWLMSQIDWRNFLNINDDGISAKYTIAEVMEDVCKYWGWTARTYRQQVLLMCADDLGEQTYLRLSPAALSALAGGDSTAGTVESVASPISFTGSFASRNNDEMTVRGHSKATVKAVANKQSEIISFAPKSVRDTMDAGGYTWVQDGESAKVGYFTTPEISSFTSQVLNGTSDSGGGAFCRRQIYEEDSTEDSKTSDMILIKRYNNGTPCVSLESVYETGFSGGSIELNGTIYQGATRFTGGEDPTNIRSFKMRIGIGHTRATAKWLQWSDAGGAVHTTWGSNQTEVYVLVKFAPVLKVGLKIAAQNMVYYNSSRIQVDDEIKGHLYVDFMGAEDEDWTRITPGTFQIADFSVNYSRDKIITTSAGTRKMTRDRNEQKEYSAKNGKKYDSNWNADCIFASDNDMEYGYGLLMDADGDYLEKAPYNGVQAIPEQHLADRVAAYWDSSRRVFRIESQTQTFIVSPLQPVIINSTKCHPVSISHNWRDDVTQFMMIELPVSNQ